MIISGLTHHGLGGDSIDKAFYNKMLADNNFESFRPELLRKVGDTGVSRLISKSEIGEDKKPASEIYFSTVPHEEIELEIADERGMSNESFYRNPQQFQKLLYYHRPIIPFIWQKKEHYTEDFEGGDDVPTGVRLIGPSRFTPVGSRFVNPGWLATRGGNVPIHPATEDLKIVEGVFKTILKNEYNIGTWREFDKIISDATGLTQRAIDSEKVFKYALDCEYRIRIPR